MFKMMMMMKVKKGQLKTIIQVPVAFLFFFGWTFYLALFKNNFFQVEKILYDDQEVWFYVR